MWLLLLAASASAPPSAPPSLVGKAAPAIEIAGPGGEASLAAMRGKVVALVFLSARCPVAGAYAARLRNLSEEYAGRVTFLGLDSGPAAPDEVQAYIAKKNLPFLVVKDQARAIADRYGVNKVPEVVVVDPGGVVRYRGRIDNSQDESRVERRELKDALVAILSGGAPASPTTVPMGCALPRAEPQGPR